jgi:small subunit ribosomal protein S4e
MAVGQDWRYLLQQTQPGSPQAQRVPPPLHHPQVLTTPCRHHLKIALNGREANIIIQDKEAGVKIDNRLRRDIKFPVGIMDVITLTKTGESYRLLYDVKGRFTLVKQKSDEAKTKLLKIRRRVVGPNKEPYVVTHDSRTIRFPNPEISEGDTVKFDLEKNTIVEFYKNEPGHLAYITAGNNVGRVGQILHVEKHLGSYDIVHLKDNNGKTFATRASNLFIIGNKKSSVTLPEGDGNYLNILEEKALRDDKRRKPSAAK